MGSFIDSLMNRRLKVIDERRTAVKVLTSTLRWFIWQSLTRFCWSCEFFLRSSKHDGEWIYTTPYRRNVDLNFWSGGVAEMRAHKSNIYERMKFYANIIRDWNFWDLRELKLSGSLQKTHSVIKTEYFMLQKLLSNTVWVCFRSNIHKASLCLKYLRWN